MHQSTAKRMCRWKYDALKKFQNNWTNICPPCLESFYRADRDHSLSSQTHVLLFKVTKLFCKCVAIVSSSSSYFLRKCYWKRWSVSDKITQNKLPRIFHFSGVQWAGYIHITTPHLSTIWQKLKILQQKWTICYTEF